MPHISDVDLWITGANLIYLASYSVRGILWLRILTIVAAVLLIPYYYLQSKPLWIAISWNLVFVGINLFWVVRLLLERWSVQLTEDEQRLRQLCFPLLNPADVARLSRMGTWEYIEAGTCLVEHDRTLARLSVIVSGKADVRLVGEKVAELSDGQFVGQIAYITGEKAPVSVVAQASMRIISWSRVKLEKFFKDRPDVEGQLGHSLGADLTRLLESAWQSSR
jgi:hypothetical protein